MRIDEIDSLTRWPGSIPDARERIRESLTASGKRLVVIDDDPTGTQTVRDVPVCLDLSLESLLQTAASAGPVFYVSTNSRSLPEDEAAKLSVQVGHSVSAAASALGFDPLLASRSDSTLRGHFPQEVEALTEGMGLECDGIVLAPAFFEGGRFTIDDVHLVQQGGELVPAAMTEFARDPVFGYHSADLKSWVEEKTRGRWSREEVLSVSLPLLQDGGPEAAAEMLSRCTGGRPVVVNAACYAHLDTFVLGLIRAEEAGKRFVYRCSASFVKSRGGFPDSPLLGAEEVCAAPGPGLVVAGSYVERTSHQLEALIRSGLAEGVEVAAGELADDSRRQREVERAAQRVERLLSSGRTALVYTSRARLPGEGKEFLEAGRKLMGGLCGIVERVGCRPAYLVAKGGITSIEIARQALGAKRCDVLGQILPGVPVWRMGEEGRWPGIAYTVFPGNVGDDQSLTRVVSLLSGGTGP